MITLIAVFLLNYLVKINQFCSPLSWMDETLTSNFFLFGFLTLNGWHFGLVISAHLNMTDTVISKSYFLPIHNACYIEASCFGAILLFILLKSFYQRINIKSSKSFKICTSLLILCKIGYLMTDTILVAYWDVLNTKEQYITI